MREILFKAKRTDNGEWVEGYYVCCRSCHYILPIFNDYAPYNGYDDRYEKWIEIDKKTLCQYTGLMDKNGRKIWENDILKGYEYPFLSDNDFNYFAIVDWADEGKCFGLYTVKNPKSSVCGISEGNFELLEDFNSKQWEAIGNIFDNPELLEDG